MATWICKLCSYAYDEEKEGVKWEELPDDWECPICGSTKDQFYKEEKDTPAAGQTETGVDATASASQVQKYLCALCSFVYDEKGEKLRWDELPDNWVCPVCGSGKDAFSVVEEQKTVTEPEAASSGVPDDYLAEWRRFSDPVETHMADIHSIAMTGKSVHEPMRTQLPTCSWDDILIKGAQLFKMPLNKSQPVSTQTIIGPGADKPLVLEVPFFVSHMSFGALSRNAKVALARGSARLQTAVCSGEGGILPEEMEAAHRYIFEYVPNKYSATDENLRKVDAIEIKFGQSAKPGMGGHLPGHKVTREIARVRGFREGVDITSPSRFPDIRNKEDVQKTVRMLRERSGGKPIGIKIAAGYLAEDIEIALFAGADFITIDGRAGGTGSALKVVKASATIPSVFALARAREILNSHEAADVSLIVTGGFRVSSDIVKALAMGADAVALGTASMMALGCQQYRICNTGKCPVGIATQDPILEMRLDVDKSAERVANFFKVYSEELKDFARLTGNSSVHGLSVDDLCTTNSEISNHTVIGHV